MVAFGPYRCRILTVAVSALTQDVLIISAQACRASAVVTVDLENGPTDIVRSSQEGIPDAGSVSVAQPVVFQTAGNEVAHGFFYPPMNDAFAAPAGDLPPLIVKSHGGPTGQTGCAYEPKIQFWTSRDCGL